MSKRVRAALALLLVAAAAVAASLLLGSSERLSERDAGEAGSRAFERHQDALGNANREGPASYADQVAELNAYPADSVTADEIAGAQAAFTDIKGHGYGRGKHSTTSWYSLGPNNSVYPASLNRHGSEYVTSGRITALAIAPTCDKSRCTVWVGAAGGGVWRTDKALSGNPDWQNVSDGDFASGAIGSLTYDAAHHTLYAGTGELAAAGDAEAGVGIYKSTDGGDHWTALDGNANFTNRAIRQITVDPSDTTGKTFYVADGRGVHGISSTTAGAVSNIPGSPPWGIFKTIDGGATFTLLAPSANLFNGQATTFGAPRGVTDVVLDPSNSQIVYATSYAQGVFRSNDGGTTWTKIHDSITSFTPPFDSVVNASTADRSEIAVVKTSPGHTRMYLTDGDSGPQPNHPELYSRFFVADDVQTGVPTFVDKTSSSTASPGYATYNFCTGQCWYDQGVYSPPGQPNMVYIFGSFVYREAPNLSQDAFHSEGRVSNGRGCCSRRTAATPSPT